MITTDEDILKSSDLISLQIDKTKTSYTIKEDLIKACMLAAATEVLGPKAGDKRQIIPISNDTVKRRIMDMAIDVEKQVIEQVKKLKYFSKELDELILSNCAIFVCLVRYEKEGSIMVNFFVVSNYLDGQAGF